MTSDAGLRVAREAKFYACRPSTLMAAGLTAYEAFCVDEALAVRLNAVERAEAAAEERPLEPRLAGGTTIPGPVI